MPLLEVPAARAHEQRRDLVVQAVLLLTGVERDRPLERVREVDLALDAVLPGGRVRVLEVGHEHLRARVERVDHHLPVDRPRDLDPAVLDLVRHGLDPPVALADVVRLRQEVGQLAVAQALGALLAFGEQLATPRAEPPLQLGEELDRVVGEDVVRACAGLYGVTVSRRSAATSASRVSRPSG